MTTSPTRSPTSDELDQFHGSLTRCTSQPGFLERFYQSFMNASPMVREKFAHTNWLRQYRMMVASFHLMSLGAEFDQNASEDGHLSRIAKSHGSAGHNIPPELYDAWLESLIEAVAAVDPEYSEEIETLWRLVMQHGITYMRKHGN